MQDFLSRFTRDLSPCISLFMTVNAQHLQSLVLYNDDLMEGLRLEVSDRAWVYM